MRSPVLALLGPTNTGKTYLAVERMLEHSSGTIGFPLRLLARENYDRVARLKGPEAVALLTGEERILPHRPRYFVCTVEAMPLDREVDFLAVDEIQLAADRERGHIFTERLLRSRGRKETMFLGAETIRPLIRKLLPEAELITRSRLSTLSYSDPKKLSHLPRRCAVIVFSVAGVYQIAERVRQLSGGAAVVFGALSPRTRNAQVGLYEAGEVDYLVATDAIGMGLNLQIDHVVFTGLSKFDGLGPRRLLPAEVAQIAGRAGRNLRDGTFASTHDIGPLPKPLVDAVEHHRFEPLSTLFWRSSELDFGSPEALLRSLEQPPPAPQLVRVRQAEDHRALSALARDQEVARVARGPEAVRLLWEVCQIPDFRNTMDAAHARLLGRIYRHLSGPARRLPESWVAAQVAALDRTEGDVEMLLSRIAGIRTWTYVSHRAHWLSDASHWQDRTRGVEDRLSDALHERLTQQFVDRRAAVLARHDPGELIAAVTETGEVLIQGLLAGRLDGFRFVPDPQVRQESRGLLAVANRALRAHVGDRVGRLVEDADDAFALTIGGQIAWRGAPVARLLDTGDPLSPGVAVLPSDLLSTPLREDLRRRLAAWTSSHLRVALGPLFRAREASLSASARGLVFSLTDTLGLVPRRTVVPQLAALSPTDRRELARLGVRIGRLCVHVPGLLRPESLRLRRLVWGLRHDSTGLPLPEGRPSELLDPRVPAATYWACGYLPVEGLAVRADRLERLASEAWRLVRAGSFTATPELAGIVGRRPEEVSGLLAALGFVLGTDGRFARRTGRGRHRRTHRG